ncbi:MAG: hypothetical protein AAFX01_05815 [Cyanobacteria bacterium J06638_28]
MCLLFEVRANWALHLLTEPEQYGSIAYEYEKNSYPLAMADVWVGHEQAESALLFLQQDDPQATETFGVDLYSSFVLKAQIRKYFGLGEQLTPSYRDRMYQAMDWLTQTDPLSRNANPPRKFWSNSQDDCLTLVDCRNTDNLRAMRETALYLMAEETGNEATRQIYQAYLERYVATLLDIGMGEWDSPKYHGHTTAAYLNLYDFAQDPEVKQLAESALDWLFFSAALKYWRGTWMAPAKRTHGEGAARFFWLYFGQALPPEKRENDWIHALMSDYRPPQTVLQLARREFTEPIEVRRTHPHYENWKPELYGPAFYETLYLGQSFQLGSLARGSAGDWVGLGLSVQQGAGTDALTVTGGGSHAIAQARNVIIWLGQTAPELTFPEGEIEEHPGVTFVQTEQTWLAVHPLPTGFVLEVGERATHGTFTQFKTRVRRSSSLMVESDVVHYQDSQGQRLSLQPQAGELPRVWRQGRLHDWADHTDTQALQQALGASLKAGNPLGLPGLPSLAPEIQLLQRPQ